jgi:flagellar FliL protein
MAHESAAVQAVPAPRSKLPILIVTMLLAALAAGSGVYVMTGARQDATVAGEQAQKASKAPAVYVKFDPPFVVNFEAKGMMRFLQVSIEAMTRDPATADLIKLHDPRLRNELLMLLSNQTYETLSTREGKERLRTEALAAVAKVISEEGGKAEQVEQLYFTSFVMQ